MNEWMQQHFKKELEKENIKNKEKQKTNESNPTNQTMVLSEINSFQKKKRKGPANVFKTVQNS